MQMNAVDTLTAAQLAYDAYKKRGTSNAGSTPSGPDTPETRTGVLPESAYSPSPTTVSPAFQQAFKAQVSPVINAQIQSAGATASGSPTQTASGGQYARGGGASSGQPGAAPDNTFPPPLSPPVLSPYQQKPVVNRQAPWITPITIAGGVVLVGGLVWALTRKRRR